MDPHFSGEQCILREQVGYVEGGKQSEMEDCFGKVLMIRDFGIYH